jgi:hypothetical protein
MIADGRNCQRWSRDFLGIETMVGRMAQGLRSSRADQQAEWLEKELLGDKIFSNTLAAKQDERIPTIVVPTVLVSFNWPVNSNRFERVEAQKYSKSGLPVRKEEVLCHPVKGETQLPAEC